MSEDRVRISREKKTIQKMIEIFCRHRHGRLNDLCGDCTQLRDYAMQSIERCPFIESKPVCGKCPVHCYKPDMRDRIRKVMRFSGPRMMIYHPVLAVMHHFDAINCPPRKQVAPPERKNPGPEQAPGS